MELSVVQGDIGSQSADALVNAAGTSLRMGSGVAGALRRAGGSKRHDTARERGPVDLDPVAVTDAYELDADTVVHATAMPHHGDGQATAESIRDATRSALDAADDHERESLVVPALGCGVAGFDLRESARLIAGETRAFDPESLRDVPFIAYSDEEYEVVHDAVDAPGDVGAADREGRVPEE